MDTFHRNGVRNTDRRDAHFLSLLTGFCYVVTAQISPPQSGIASGAGIVLGSMEEARAVDRAKHETDDLLERLRSARNALEDAERELQRTHRSDG